MTAENEMKQIPYNLEKSISNLKRANHETVVVRMGLRAHRQDYTQIFHKSKYRQISQLQTSEPDLHGTWNFPRILNRFKRKDTPDCACGELGSPKH